MIHGVYINYILTQPYENKDITHRQIAESISRNKNCDGISCGYCPFRNLICYDVAKVKLAKE